MDVIRVFDCAVSGKRVIFYRAVKHCLGIGLLAEFAEGFCSDGRGRQVESHLAECESCRHVLEVIAPRPSDSSPSVSDASSTVVGGPCTTTLPAAPGPGAQGELAAGDRVGRYLVERTLGRGAMGIVYAAYDPDIDRRIALKILHLDARDPARRTRVLSEARAMARVGHPDVITVHDVGVRESALFIAMELVEGGTLRQWLAAKPRSPGEILEVFFRAGRALAKAHAVGLVHRDFKPDNVLVGHDNRVRVTDFGLARLIEGDDASRAAFETPANALRPRSVFVGTPAYMSPEQLRGEPATLQSDVFAFSVALWEALFRGRPFAAKTVAELERKIRAGDLSPVQVPDEATEALRRALLPGLTVTPSQRYRSMDALLAALEAVSASPRRKRRVVVRAAVAVAMAAVLGWGGWHSSRAGTRPASSLIAATADLGPPRANPAPPPNAPSMASAQASTGPPEVIATRPPALSGSAAPRHPKAPAPTATAAADPFGSSRE